jgi:hypothetical protein
MIRPYTEIDVMNNVRVSWRATGGSVAISVTVLLALTQKSMHLYEVK